MVEVVDLVAFLDSPRARTRFINQRMKKNTKKFLVKQRGYKRPDFNRMILDLCTHLGWTHEKIADVLPVANASTVSEWSRGGKPNFENGEAFIELWKMETGIEIVPREGEWMTYKYKIGQLDIFDDGGLCDQVIEQLDCALSEPVSKISINHDEYKNGDLVMYTDGQPVLLVVRMHRNKVLVSKYGSFSAPNTPHAEIRKANEGEIKMYSFKQWKEEGRKGKPVFIHDVMDREIEK